MRRTRGKASLVALVAAAILTLATACGGLSGGEVSSDSSTVAQPPAYGPVVSGHDTCIYLVDDDECEESDVDPAYWVMVDEDALLGDPYLEWFLVYHLYYSDDDYFKKYLPKKKHKAHKALIRAFDKKYSKKYAKYEKKAKPKASPTKSQGSTGGSSSCNAMKLPTAFNATQKPKDKSTSTKGDKPKTSTPSSSPKKKNGC